MINLVNLLHSTSRDPWVGGNRGITVIGSKSLTHQFCRIKGLYSTTVLSLKN